MTSHSYRPIWDTGGEPSHHSVDHPIHHLGRVVLGDRGFLDDLLSIVISPRHS